MSTQRRREALRFAEVVLGVTVTDQPPSAESRLGRLIALQQAWEAGDLDADRYRQERAALLGVDVTRHPGRRG